MYAVATFLIVAVITTIFTQLSRGALMATGVPPDIAGFQARSAFSGAGFTTTEAENVVNHPARRKIIGATMFVGSLGTPTLVVTVLVGLIGPGPGTTLNRLLVGVSGALLLIIFIGSKTTRRWLTNLGRHYAQSRLLPALAHDIHELYTVAPGFVVVSVAFETEPEESPRSLRGMDHVLPGLSVLGVRRGDEFIGEPPADITLHEGDELVVFGSREKLTTLGLGG